MERAYRFDTGLSLLLSSYFEQLGCEGDVAKPNNPAATIIRDRLYNNVPHIAAVLGSGLGAVGDRLKDPIEIEFGDLSGFPRPTVKGHMGRLLVGDLDGIRVLILQNRAHVYEGYDLAELALPVRTLKAAGVEILVLTNAAGSLSSEVGPGRLMLVTDHINWSGMNPMIGPNHDEIRPRFFDMGAAYDPGLCKAMRTAARKSGIDLAEGVYCWCPGPSFETPA